MKSIIYLHLLLNTALNNCSSTNAFVVFEPRWKVMKKMPFLIPYSSSRKIKSHNHQSHFSSSTFYQIQMTFNNDMAQGVEQSKSSQVKVNEGETIQQKALKTSMILSLFAVLTSSSSASALPATTASGENFDQFLDKDTISRLALVPTSSVTNNRQNNYLEILSSSSSSPLKNDLDRFVSYNHEENDITTDTRWNGGDSFLLVSTDDNNNNSNQLSVNIENESRSAVSYAKEGGKWFFVIYVVVSLIAGAVEMSSRLMNWIENNNQK
mmetsp:Transcript_2068/g.2816  ORF Transcript_2068/g.2816 Transcript_2068/m.2816 type:complete len:267 (+) Transcript_2068:66-866(+)